MLKTALALAVLSLTTTGSSSSRTHLDYTLRVDSSDLSGISVELRVRGAPASLTLAAHAHPEYDDKYWRYVEDLRATGAGGRTLRVSRQDSVLWHVSNGAGDVIVRYRVRFPRENAPRAAWRPFLAPTGGLVGGPHSFLYVVGQEKAAASVKLDLPLSWRVGTGLAGTSAARTLVAANIHTLMESPMLVGRMSEWSFRLKDVPHRVFYWSLPNATPFDTTAFVRGIERLAAQAVNLFGTMPYREYTFLFQDGAFGGGLEHPNSVTLGALSAELARNPHTNLEETAHEFVHTWNLMAIKPVEYREVDYRQQAPVAGLWFSEGLTLFYADLLLRRAGLPTSDSTRVGHLENLIERYLSSPGNARFSAEQVSRVAYNAPPGALGDYTASSHLQGELIGSVLDLLVRGATDGTRSMDDVMRLMYARFNGRGFTGADVQKAVDDTCRCASGEVFEKHVRSGGAIDFDRYLAPLGLVGRTSWTPATGNDGQPRRDQRFWGWQEGNEPLLRVRVADPNSVWGRAGLHTNDHLVSVNGVAVRTWPELRAFINGFAIGDSASIVVQRPSGRFETKVVMRGFDRPVVRIEPLSAVSERQRRLRTEWMQGR